MSEITPGVSHWIHCANCGKKRKISPFALKLHKHHFCGRACCTQFQREHNSEFQKTRVSAERKRREVIKG